jgi:Mrp family chromosome partitioning ATPase
MSRFYEALLREEQRLKLQNRSQETCSGRDSSAASGIEASFSVWAKGSKPNSEEPYSSTPANVKEILKPPEVPCPGPTSKANGPSAEFTGNGFRHLTVQFRENSRLSFRTDPGGFAAEQFRLLRRTLNQTFDKGAVLMITSPGMGDGKTLTSLNLCTCLADSGDPTLLVEANVRRPAVGGILGCAMGPPGIEDVWDGKVEPRRAIHLIEELSFHAAMVVKILKDPPHLHGTSVKPFLAWAQQHFRWVVLDAAPVLPAADVCELLPLTDAALLVIRAQSTSRELSKRAIELLGKRLHGVIFNEATIDSNPYFRYLK